MCVRAGARERARALVPSYFHPAYSACFTRANLSKPHCEGIWGPHAAWPAFACVFFVCIWVGACARVHMGAHVYTN